MCDIITAIEVINNYLKNNNSIYLYDNSCQNENNVLKLTKSSELKYVLMSEIKFEVKGE